MPLKHISINVSDIGKTREFYVAALKPLGYKVMMEFYDGKVVGMGGKFGLDFWFNSLDTPSADGSQTRHKDMGPDTKSGERDPTGRMHIAFEASNRQKVREFYEAAIAGGAKCNGPPGLRPEYFATYYAAFVLDPEGRNIDEAACVKPGFLAEPWGYKGWSTVGLAVGAAAGCVGKYMGWL